jgi:hypothetical protein
VKEAPQHYYVHHTYDLAIVSMAPSLVSPGSLGTIYEGVSFFITGGNMVAIGFIAHNVFGNSLLLVAENRELVMIHRHCCERF